MSLVRCMGGGGVKPSPNILYLFNDGDQCMDVTDGWVASNGYGSYYYREDIGTHGKVTFDDTYMYVQKVTTASYYCFGARTVKKITVDDYDRLHILYANGKLASIDISKLEGSYYVGIGMNWYNDSSNNGSFGLSTLTQNSSLEVKELSIPYTSNLLVQRIWLENAKYKTDLLRDWIGETWNEVRSGNMSGGSLTKSLDEYQTYGAYGNNNASYIVTSPTLEIGNYKKLYIDYSFSIINFSQDPKPYASIDVYLDGIKVVSLPQGASVIELSGFSEMYIVINTGRSAGSSTYPYIDLRLKVLRLA